MPLPHSPLRYPGGKQILAKASKALRLEIWSRLAQDLPVKLVDSLTDVAPLGKVFELGEKIQQENWLDFDVALASQALMGQVSRLGKVLGPRGLMPTPKAGTVIPANGDVAAAVREFKAGKVEYRADAGGNVHAGVGKLSFEEDKLADNITATSLRTVWQVKNADRKK